MTTRLEAAVHGFHKAMVDPITEPSDWNDEMRLALVASDEVLFSDEAVSKIEEKVADFFNDAFPLFSVLGDPKWSRPELRLAIRHVIQALKETANV
jgi:hypothetical protein